MSVDVKRVAMKNHKCHHMFPDGDYLAILIIKIAKHARLNLQLLVITASLLTSQSCMAQVNATDAVRVRDHIYKGNASMQHHDYNGAISEYEQALEIDPMNSSAKDNIVLTHNNWGIELFRQKKYDEAKEQWTTALKLNPADRNAKNNLNVLKAQLSKLGQSASGQSGESNKSGSEGESKASGAILPKGAQAAQEDKTPVPSAVILGHPSSSNSNPSTMVIPDSTPGASSTFTTGGTNAGSSSAAIISRPSSPTPTPVMPSPTTPAASSASSSLGSSNIEDKLGALETKVYGRQSKDVPILQRLERIERDTSSRPSLGSINDRVQTLLKTYGL